MTTPTVGRIVHYVSHGTPVRADGTQAFTAECRAAIITEVESVPRSLGGERVGLAVFNPTGVFFHPIAKGGCVYRDPTVAPDAGGSWHWPERADDLGGQVWSTPQG